MWQRLAIRSGNLWQIAYEFARQQPTCDVQQIKPLDKCECVCVFVRVHVQVILTMVASMNFRYVANIRIAVKRHMWQRYETLVRG